MAIIPTVQMKTAYEIILYTNKNTVEFGKKKEHKLTYKYDPNTDSQLLTYIHYGTVVLTIKMYNANDDREFKLYGGFSASDRNNINGLLKLTDVNNVKCRMINDSLMFVNVNNDKKKCRFFVIDNKDNLYFMPDCFCH